MQSPSVPEPAVAVGEDPRDYARLMSAVYDATMAGDRAPARPRQVIGDSWQRLMSQGIDPDEMPDPVVESYGLDALRGASGLLDVLDEITHGLESLVAEGENILVVADAQGRVLWRSGLQSRSRPSRPPRLRRGRALGGERRRHQRHRHRAGVAAGRAGVLRRALPSQPPPVDVCGRTDQGSEDRAGDRRRRRVRARPQRCTPPPSRWWTRWPGWPNRTCANSTTKRSTGSGWWRRRSSPASAARRSPSTTTAGWPRWTPCPVHNRIMLPADIAPGRVRFSTFGPCDVEPLPGGWLVRLAADAPTGRAARVILDLRNPDAPSLQTSVSSPHGGTTSRRVTPRSCWRWPPPPPAARRPSWPTTCTATGRGWSPCAPRSPGCASSSPGSSPRSPTASRHPSTSR